MLFRANGTGLINGNNCLFCDLVYSKHNIRWKCNVGRTMMQSQLTYTIKIENDKGNIYAQKNMLSVGYVSFTIEQEQLWTICHVVVNDNFQGAGIGQALIAYLVDYVRQKQIHLNLRCPYAKHVFKLHDEYRDVVVNYDSRKCE